MLRVPLLPNERVHPQRLLLQRQGEVEECYKAHPGPSLTTRGREDFTKLISITVLIWIHDFEGEP